MPQPNTVKVQHFRFRNDDGSETTATWLAGEDQTATIHLPGSNTNFRLRMSIQDLLNNVTNTYGVAVAKNGAAAVTIGAATSNVRGVVTSNLTDGANTTNQLTSELPYVTTAGVVDATNATSHGIVMAVNTQTEIEWSLILMAADVTTGDYLDFTIVDAGGAATVLQQYSGNIRLVIASIHAEDKAGTLEEQEGDASGRRYQVGVLPD